MALFSKNIQSTSDLISNLYTTNDANQVAEKLNQILVSSGYKLVEGTTWIGTYEKGNRTLRIIFGAFVKYFKLSVIVKQSDAETVTATIFKQTSGMSGGLIGVAQVKNELAKIHIAAQTI